MKTKFKAFWWKAAQKHCNHFIDQNLWDEARVITNREMIIEKGINAPEMKNFQSRYSRKLFFRYSSDYFSRK